MSRLPLLSAGLLSPEVKKLIKAEYLASDLTLTKTGRRVLISILFQENIDRMVSQAETVIADSLSPVGTPEAKTKRK